MSMTDELLGEPNARILVEALRTAEPGNPFTATSRAAGALGALTLSGRARALARELLTDVDGDPERLTAIVDRALQLPDFEGWILWPAGLGVAWSSVRAGSPEAFDAGMEALRALTPRMTSEFAIRPMLLHDLDRSLAHLTAWTADPDRHVRRLASEGSRPLLPWAERIPALVADPAPTRAILDALYDDPEESVRRSVANHLNDHSRAHPAFAVAAARGWREAGGDHVDRTARHALRTLVKRGDPDALELLGFPPARVAVSPLELSRDPVPAGGSVRFRSRIENLGEQPARLVIDYVLTFPGARGTERSKVFKIAQRSLEPGEHTLVEMSHSFRPITTRRYYPGHYALALQINGVAHERARFTVAEEE